MRVYTSRNDPLDFCRRCAPAEDDAQRRYGDLGDGPDNRGNCFAYDAEHPPYQGEDFWCERCNATLTVRD